ncbi:hypothetical protein VP01_1507g2 [Puccinia sorghi]|uniref:Uncharacterized protein n=1 Tax=Puccinia sorghi TaxID=27349 RepID=A0A0L6VJ11_9BASI|nr:hypothetical protein VP01_1507g2 [Puccinia sorghi]
MAEYIIILKLGCNQLDAPNNNLDDLPDPLTYRFFVVKKNVIPPCRLSCRQIILTNLISKWEEILEIHELYPHDFGILEGTILVHVRGVAALLPAPIRSDLFFVFSCGAGVIYLADRSLVGLANERHLAVLWEGMIPAWLLTFINACGQGCPVRTRIDMSINDRPGKRVCRGAGLPRPLPPISAEAPLLEILPRPPPPHLNLTPLYEMALWHGLSVQRPEEPSISPGGKQKPFGFGAGGAHNLEHVAKKKKKKARFKTKSNGSSSKGRALVHEWGLNNLLLPLPRFFHVDIGTRVFIPHTPKLIIHLIAHVCIAQTVSRFIYVCMQTYLSLWSTVIPSPCLNMCNVNVIASTPLNMFFLPRDLLSFESQQGIGPERIIFVLFDVEKRVGCNGLRPNSEITSVCARQRAMEKVKTARAQWRQEASCANAAGLMRSRSCSTRRQPKCENMGERSRSAMRRIRMGTGGSSGIRSMNITVGTAHFFSSPCLQPQDAAASPVRRARSRLSLPVCCVPQRPLLLPLLCCAIARTRPRADPCLTLHVHKLRALSLSRYNHFILLYITLFTFPFVLLLNPCSLLNCNSYSNSKKKTHWRSMAVKCFFFFSSIQQALQQTAIGMKSNCVPHRKKPESLFVATSKTEKQLLRRKESCPSPLPVTILHTYTIIISLICVQSPIPAIHECSKEKTNKEGEEESVKRKRKKKKNRPGLMLLREEVPLESPSLPRALMLEERVLLHARLLVDHFFFFLLINYYISFNFSSTCTPIHPSLPSLLTHTFLHPCPLSSRRLLPLTALARSRRCLCVCGCLCVFMLSVRAYIYIKTYLSPFPLLLVHLLQREHRLKKVPFSFCSYYYCCCVWCLGGPSSSSSSSSFLVLSCLVY